MVWFCRRNGAAGHFHCHVGVFKHVGTPVWVYFLRHQCVSVRGGCWLLLVLALLLLFDAVLFDPVVGIGIHVAHVLFLCSICL